MIEYISKKRSWGHLRSSNLAVFFRFSLFPLWFCFCLENLMSEMRIYSCNHVVFYPLGRDGRDGIPGPPGPAGN